MGNSVQHVFRFFLLVIIKYTICKYETQTNKKLKDKRHHHNLHLYVVDGKMRV